jgi:hypothetical protein
MKFIKWNPNDINDSKFDDGPIRSKQRSRYYDNNYDEEDEDDRSVENTKWVCGGDCGEIDGDWFGKFSVDRVLR